MVDYRYLLLTEKDFTNKPFCVYRPHIQTKFK